MTYTDCYEASAYVHYKHLTIYAWFEYKETTFSFQPLRYEYKLYPDEIETTFGEIKELVIERDDSNKDDITLDFYSLRPANQEAIKELLMNSKIINQTEKVVGYDD